MALFVLSLCPYDISVGVWAFVMGLSQISSVFSHYFIVTSNYDLQNDRVHLLVMANTSAKFAEDALSSTLL